MGFFLVLDIGLKVFNDACWLDIQSDGVSSEEGLDKYLHSSSQSEVQMKGWLPLDLVVREGSAIPQLLSN